MRRYRDDWNAKKESGERRYSMRSTLAAGLVGALQARSHGIGAISTSAHGPSFADDGRTCGIPTETLAGLRDIGDAGDIIRLDHDGWFADAHRSETYRGHVWQLPAARDGSPRFIAGYMEPASGYAVLACNRGHIEIFTCDKSSDDYRATDTEACKEAARAADHLAERDAESEREYSEKWQEASGHDSDREDARADMKAARLVARGALRSLRELRAAGLTNETAEQSHVLDIRNATQGAAHHARRYRNDREQNRGNCRA